MDSYLWLAQSTRSVWKHKPINNTTNNHNTGLPLNYSFMERVNITTAWNTHKQFKYFKTEYPPYVKSFFDACKEKCQLFNIKLWNIGLKPILLVTIFFEILFNFIKHYLLLLYWIRNVYYWVLKKIKNKMLVWI